jgi:hypothetical protein
MLLGQYGLSLAHAAESLFEDFVLGRAAHVLVGTGTAGMVAANLAAGLTTMQATVLVTTLANAIVDRTYRVEILGIQCCDGRLLNELGFVCGQ